jgi:hypothetical protein
MTFVPYFDTHLTEKEYLALGNVQEHSSIQSQVTMFKHCKVVPQPNKLRIKSVSLGGGTSTKVQTD